MVLDNETAVVPPEQIVWEDGKAAAIGVGFTVTTAFTGGPVHPLAVDVIVYVTAAGFWVRFVSDCAIVLPLPADSPETLPDGESLTVHENAEAEVALDKVIAVVPPEQMVWDDGKAATIGVGFTVMVTVIGIPAQPFAEGTTV